MMSIQQWMTVNGKWTSKGRCNKCKKLGHFARECKTPEFIIQNMKGNSKAQKKDYRNRVDSKPKVHHHTKVCFHLRTAKAAVANTKRGRDPKRDAVAYNSKKKPRVSVHDSDDDESRYNSMVCVEEEVNMAQGMSDVVYLGSGCNKMIIPRGST